MSLQALEWVFRHSATTGTDRLVLLAIANHADRGGGGAYPSADLIAAEAGCQRAAAFRSIRRLEADGAISVEHGGGRHRPNTYRVLMAERSHSDTVSVLENGNNGDTVSDPETVTETVTSEPETVTTAPENGVTAIPEPTTNQLQPLEPTPLPPSPPARTRGHRLPEDFAVTDEMLRWAQREVPTIFVTGETAKFRDHWKSAAGPSSQKLDWVAAWRNWLRKAAEYAPRTNGHGRPTGLDAVAEYARQEGLLS